VLFWQAVKLLGCKIIPGDMLFRDCIIFLRVKLEWQPGIISPVKIRQISRYANTFIAIIAARPALSIP